MRKRLGLIAAAVTVAFSLAPGARAWTDDDVVKHTQAGNGTTGPRD